LSKTDAELYRLNKEGHQTFAELAKMEGTTRSAISGKIHRYGLQLEDDKNRALFAANLGTPLKLKGDAMVVGDVHVPTTDYDFALLPAQIAQKHLKKGSRRLIIAGDFFNLDVFSTYSAILHHASWAEERDAGRALIKRWLDVFDEIYIVMGNHDRRLQKWAKGELDETDIFGMLIQNPRVVVSNYGWLTVETDSGPYRVTHGRNYSINQLTVSAELANKFQCNIISHHEHHLAVGWDRYGRWVIVNNGTLVNPAKLDYAVMDDGKNPNMKQGFTLLRNGTPHLFGKAPFTDWGLWI
jgi:predicted phosphodiesterase